MYSKYSNASETGKYSECSTPARPHYVRARATARHNTNDRRARSMARRPRLGITTHQDVACRYPTGHLQATRASNQHDHERRRRRLWLSTASRRRGRRLWATRGLLGRVVVAGGGAPSVDGRTPLGGVLPAHNGHAARSGADAGPTTASGRNQLRPGYGRPRSRKMGWAGTGPVPGPGASRPWLRRCARPPSRGPRTRVAELTPCLGAPIVAVSHSRVN